jgi:hypothetical protein
MKTITCVTTFNQQIYDRIGSVMLESWKKYWDSGKLVIYSEGVDVSLHEKIEVVDWREKCFADWDIFQQKTGDSSTKKFAKKGFAFLNALENVKTDYLVWLDADLLFHKPFQYENFIKILSDEKLIGYFDVFYQEIPNYKSAEYLDIKSRKHMAAESGFVIINCKHKNFVEYARNYRKLFESLTKPEVCVHWYDGEVVAESARNFLDQVQDLSLLRTTNKTQTPLNKTWLSEFFTHQKGKSKDHYSIEDLKKFTNL